MTEKKIHVLKCVQPYFNLTLKHRKLWQLRINDRDFKEGDFLNLKEYDPVTDFCSGRMIQVLITYIFFASKFGRHLGLPAGYCIMSIRPTGFKVDIKEPKK